MYSSSAATTAMMGARNAGYGGYNAGYSAGGGGNAGSHTGGAMAFGAYAHNANNGGNGGYNNAQHLAADQSNGGGFFSQSGPMAGGSPDDRPGSSSRKRGDQSLRAVTVRQLLSHLSQPHPDARHELDGHELQQLSLVARVIQVPEVAARLVFKVHDGTGSIDITMFFDQGDPQTTRVVERIYENVWVRVIGVYRLFHNKNAIVAYSVRPITNYNEIAMHMAEVVATKLYLMKGSLVQPGGQTGGMAMDGGTYQLQGGDGDGAGAGSAYQSMNNTLTHQTDFHDPLHNAVFAIIRATPRTNEGVHKNAIAQELVRTSKGRQNYTAADAYQAIDSLATEGHLYCTIDDDHIQLTG